MMMSCIQHDIFTGASTKCMKPVKGKIISKKLLLKKCALFRKIIEGTDNLSWMHTLHEESFKTKLLRTNIKIQ